MEKECSTNSNSIVKPHVVSEEESQDLQPQLQAELEPTVEDISDSNKVNVSIDITTNDTSECDDVADKYIARVNKDIDVDGNYIDGRKNIAPSFIIKEDTVLLSKRQIKKARRMIKSGDGTKVPAMQAATGITETTSYIENDLRKVYPYKFVFGTFVKSRWIGRTIEDVIMDEFSYGLKEKSDLIFKYNKVKINKHDVVRTYLIKDGDYLESTIHRHEMSVTSQPLKVVYEDEHTLVVHKPCSIPIHPCGRFRHNTLTFMLALQDYKSLRTLHRLDRLTSGMVIFAKHEPATKKYMADIAKRSVVKTYLARVVGKFPEGYMECSEPLGELCPKIGLWRVIRGDKTTTPTPTSTPDLKKRRVVVAPSTSVSGRDSCTGFQVISYNGTSSVVLCRPYTGRTHQIRVHLQYLGFPIIDDPLYRGEVWGSEGGKDGDFGKSDEQIIKDLLEIHARHNFTESGYTTERPTVVVNDDRPTSYSVHRDWLKNLKDKENGTNVTEETVINEETEELPEKKQKIDEETEELPAKKQKIDDDVFNVEKMHFDEKCLDCLQPYRDPTSNDLHMCLHALSYEGPDWSYNTTPPEWAKAEYKK